MKKITLTLCLALAGLILHAQEDTSQAYRLNQHITEVRSRVL